MKKIRDAIYRVVQQHRPMNVRQVFYQLASVERAIPKTEAQYKKTVCRLLTEMRLSGQIPYSWIVDETRRARKATTYAGLGQSLDIFAKAYRRDLWAQQPRYVEIWLEKEALAGVVWPEVWRYEVPLMVTRGYPSLSFLYGAAEAIKAVNKPTHIYHFADYDPSGQDIVRHVKERLTQLAPHADITFHRAAVTPQQIREMDLPTRPTKKTDSRAPGFRGESVEVDAIPPAALRQMARQCIEQHIDQQQLAATKRIEQLERETLEELALDHWDEGGGDAE